MIGRAATPVYDSQAGNVQPGEPLIAFKNIHLQSEGEDVLRGVSFELYPRETKVLLGVSGTGKTVLLKMGCGLIRPKEGSVMVMGHDLTKMTEDELLQFRRQLGFVFQEGALFDSMTVSENVAFRLMEEEMDEAEIRSRVIEALKFVEMEDSIDKYPSELSGGMRRRVSIARALIDRPAIVFYDSPTAGLDPVTSQTIINLILRGRDTQDVTSMLATHRVQDAFGLANYRFDKATGKVVSDEDRAPNGNAAAAAPPGDAASENAAAGGGGCATNVLVLREGGIYFEGPADEMLKSSDAYLKKFLASAE